MGPGWREKSRRTLPVSFQRQALPASSRPARRESSATSINVALHRRVVRCRRSRRLAGSRRVGRERLRVPRTGSSRRHPGEESLGEEAQLPHRSASTTSSGSAPEWIAFGRSSRRESARRLVRPAEDGARGGRAGGPNVLQGFVARPRSSFRWASTSAGTRTPREPVNSSIVASSRTPNARFAVGLCGAMRIACSR